MTGPVAEPDEPVPPWRRRVLGLFLVVLAVAWALSIVRTEVNQRRLNDQQQQIDANTRTVRLLQWGQCTARNDATRKQNALIDAAIAAERRKPNPDQRRIRDLTDFRGATPDCGDRPR